MNTRMLLLVLKSSDQISNCKLNCYCLIKTNFRNTRERFLTKILKNVMRPWIQRTSEWEIISRSKYSIFNSKIVFFRNKPGYEGTSDQNVLSEQNVPHQKNVLYCSVLTEHFKMFLFCSQEHFQKQKICRYTMTM